MIKGMIVHINKVKYGSVMSVNFIFSLNGEWKMFGKWWLYLRHKQHKLGVQMCNINFCADRIHVSLFKKCWCTVRIALVQATRLPGNGFFLTMDKSVRSVWMKKSPLKYRKLNILDPNLTVLTKFFFNEFNVDVTRHEWSTES